MKSTTHTMRVAGVEFRVRNVAVERVGDRVGMTPATVERVWQLVARELARRGAITGDGFRFMRKAVKLTAVELAKLLDVTPETISAWETGRTPINRAAWAAVAQLASEKLVDSDAFARTLRAAQRPQTGKRAELRVE